MVVHKKYKFVVRKLWLLCLLLIVFLQFSTAQHIVAAFSSFENQFDEWELYFNETDYMILTRQFGKNEARRWQFRYADSTEVETYGFVQLKWIDDLNYWDISFGNEHLHMRTVYGNQYHSYRIVHGDKSLVIEAQDNFNFRWKDRYYKDFDWEMYRVYEDDINSWYIDDSSTNELTFPMRIAAIVLVLELSCYGLP